MSVKVLPDMDEPRLKSLGKQLMRSRKASIIYGDKVKDQFDVYKKSIDKEQKSISYKHSLKSIRLKKNLAQVRGTQKYLRKKREYNLFEDSDDNPFGIYNGEPLYSSRREVNEIIKQKHPRVRRLKKVDQFLQSSKNNGRILDDEDAKLQFEMIMRPMPERSQLLQREKPFGLTFIEDRREVLSLNSPSSSGRESFTPRSSPSKLALPPIQATKSFVKGTIHTNGRSIKDLRIRRASKCINSNDNGFLPNIARLGVRRNTTIL